MNEEPINIQSKTFLQGLEKSNQEDIFSYAKQLFQDKQPQHSYGTDTKTEHIPLSPEVIGHIGTLPMTNSLVFHF